MTLDDQCVQGLRGIQGPQGETGAVTTSTLDGASGDFNVDGNLNVGGVATVSTATQSTNSTQVASTKFVQDALNAVKALSGSSNLLQLLTTVDLKAPIANPVFTGTVVGITGSTVGLGNVDNTNDASKPISTAAKTSLDLKAPLANPLFTGVITVNDKKAVVLSDADLVKLMILINQ